MKTFTRVLRQEKTATSGLGAVKVTLQVCRAKTLKGISTAPKSTRTESYGWKAIECASDTFNPNWIEA